MAISFLRRRQLNPVLNDMVEPTVFGPVQRPGFASARKPLFGDGYLAGDPPDGTTTVEGVPTPITVRVVLRTPQGSTGDGLLVAETQSNAAGLWKVEGLNPLLRYDVIGRLLGKKDVIVSDVTPKVDSAVVLSYFDAVMQYSPVGYWRLGETAGTTAFDVGSFAKNGVYTGTFTLGRPSLIPSDPDNASLGCDGTGYVAVNVPAGTYQLVGCTWLCTIKCTSVDSGDRYIWHLGILTVNGQQGLAVLIRNGQIMLSYLSGGWQSATFTGITLTTGVEYRIALRINSATSISLLVNGALIQTVALPAALPGVSAIINLRIGTVNYPGTFALTGDIDEFAIIPSLLTDEQIYELENAANSI